MKDQITAMVAAALKPFYHRKEVDKERYTVINKSVSRMLYDKIWDAGGLLDQATKERWTKVAREEVVQAVREGKSGTSTPGATPAAAKPATPAATSEQPAPNATTEVPMRPATVKVT
jgi:hypothetical protein